MTRAAALLVALLAAAPAQAATQVEDVVDAAAAVGGVTLEFASGARAAGLAEAQTASSSGVTALGWNPAGLAGTRGFAAAMTYEALPAGDVFDNVALACGWPSFAVGAELGFLNYANEISRDSTSVSQGELVLSDVVIRAGAAVRADALFGREAAVGATLEVLGGTFEVVGGRGVPKSAAGLGALVRANPRLSLGLSLVHQGISALKDGPAAVRGGAAYTVLDPVLLCGDLGYRLSDGAIEAALAVEWSPVRALHLRAGYHLRGGTTGPGGLTGLAAGLGVRLAMFALDYSVQPFGRFGEAHRVSVEFSRI
ncbi:MAG: hypothetical protein AAB152_18550 [Candidatus Coatesbacteria bacterium]